MNTRKQSRTRQVQHELEKLGWRTDLLSPTVLGHETGFITINYDENDSILPACIHYQLDDLASLSLEAIKLARASKTEFIFSRPIYIDGKSKEKIFLVHTEQVMDFNVTNSGEDGHLEVGYDLADGCEDSELFLKYIKERNQESQQKNANRVNSSASLICLGDYRNLKPKGVIH